MKSIFYILGIIAVVLVAESCKHEIPDPTGGGTTDTTGTGGGGGGGGTGGGDTTDTTGIVTCDPNTVYFQQQILPILVSSCAVPNLGCHNTATSNNKGVVLTSYNSLISSDDAWDTDKTPLDQDFWDVIEDGEMPEPSSGITLTAEQRNLIFKWLQQGAQNNSCEPSIGSCDTTNVSFSQDVMPIITTHCKGCHSGTSPQANIVLEDYGTVQSVASTQRNGISLLSGVINHQAGFKNMPYNQPKISTCKILTIESWINKGMPNN